MGEISGNFESEYLIFGLKMGVWGALWTRYTGHESRVTKSGRFYPELAKVLNAIFSQENLSTASPVSQHPLSSIPK
jgi:hypothetical protein